MTDDAGTRAAVEAAGHVSDIDGLRSLYRPPTPFVVDKVVDRIHQSVRDFLARSPLMVVATTDGAGVDASPRGGPPGFVQVLDDHRIAFGDLSGNNRLDSFGNVVTNPAVGLLFLVPGGEETVRVNGRAAIVTDETIRERCAIDGVVPKVAVVVEVHECFLHCGKALRRSGVWRPETWPDADDVPSTGAIVNDHFGIDVDPKAIEADLDAAYRATLWEPGG